MTTEPTSTPKMIEDARSGLVDLVALPLPEEARTLLAETLRHLDQAARLSEQDQQRLEEKEQEMSKFVSTVAHELRIPMTSIMGYTDLLKQGAMGPVNENQLNFLSVIRENVGRMSRLVSDLSDIYKVKSGRLHMEVSPSSLRAAAESAVAAMRKEIEARSQRVEVSVAEDLPKVSADPQRLEQMIRYLLENASLYSPEGKPIQVRARPDGEMVRLMVADEGIGVDPEDQPMIFTQFFRSEREEVREHKGWGLSLCVVESMAGWMGGRAGYETQPGAGSTFWFALPAAN